MSGAVPLLPTYVFMTWRERERYIFLLHIKINHFYWPTIALNFIKLKG